MEFILSISLAYSAPSFVQKLIDHDGILSIHHRGDIISPYHPWLNVVCKK